MSQVSSQSEWKAYLGERLVAIGNSQQELINNLAHYFEKNCDESITPIKIYKGGVPTPLDL